jgi:glycosyltransferase involved in cell wall biosynthesis
MAQYAPTAFPAGLPLVILAARMLWDKGVGTFVEIARALQKDGIKARFALVGESDPGNPAAVPGVQLEEWRDAGIVEWWGRCADMPDVFRQASVVCLPTTYGEGIPKVLIEAAACGRPIVAYDVPGCREVVRDAENGFLVPRGDVAGLASAIRTLLADSELRTDMGRKGRKIAERDFSEEMVFEQTIGVYRELTA